MAVSASKKTSYTIKVSALLYDSKLAEGNTKPAFTLAQKNIEEFTITSNPKKINITLYKLKLKGLELTVQDIFLNSNLVLYIKISEIRPGDDSSDVSLVMDNMFKVYNMAHSKNGNSLSIDYDLITFTASDLLSSQYFANNAQKNEVLISHIKPKELVTNLISESGKRMTNQLLQTIKEYTNGFDISAFPERDIIVRTKMEPYGENIQAFRNLKIPVNENMNDITCMQYIIDNFMLQYTPTWFIFDDSRMTYLEESLVITDNVDVTNLDTTKAVARLYTYVFINMCNIQSMAKSNCWYVEGDTNVTDQFGFTVNDTLKNAASGNDTSDSVVLDLNNTLANKIVPGYVNEWRRGSTFSRIDALINIDDLRSKLRSKIFLVHSDGTEEIAPVNTLIYNGALINTMRIETEIDAKNYLVKLQCDKFLYENDASLWKAHFTNMRYNVLDYNVTYNIIDKEDYSYVLASFTKTFTFSQDVKNFMLDTQAEFLHLPTTISVLSNATSFLNTATSFLNTVANYISDAGGTIAGLPEAYVNNLVKTSKQWHNMSKAERLAYLEKIEANGGSGQTSYYNVTGNKTANGEVYDGKSHTCASRTLPFGTMLEVTDVKTGKTVIVRVNDRGPYAPSTGEQKGQGLRELDLSPAAASVLGMTNAGVANTTYKIVGYNGKVGNWNRPI